MLLEEDKKNLCTCGQEMVLRKRNNSRGFKHSQKYYFEKYWWCYGCKRIVHDERFKVLTESNPIFKVSTHFSKKGKRIVQQYSSKTVADRGNLSKQEFRRRKRQEVSEYKFQIAQEAWGKADFGSIPVPFPKRLSESEVQAELWSVLKSKGYNARLEVSDTVKRGNTYQQRARFDIVIYSKKKPVIIEVKTIKSKLGDKQILKYSKYNALLLSCIGRQSIDEVVKKVEQYLST